MSAEPRIEDVASLDDPRVAPFRDLKQAPRGEGDELFPVEGRLPVRRLFEGSLYAAHSLLVTPAALASLADLVAADRIRVPIYRASEALLRGIVGFDLHRGCIAAAQRGAARTAQQVIESAAGPDARLVWLEGLANADNVGASFRNAWAFGAGGVLVSPDTLDPLYRKCVRVSVGGALRVPFARTPEPAATFAALARAGFRTLALTPDPAAQPIAQIARELAPGQRLALLLGSEGDGLRGETLAAADARVRISLAEDADSLGAATALAVALHALDRRAGA